MPASDLPNIGAPATRALMSARIYTLSDVAKYTRDEIRDMHGVGPKVLNILEREMRRRGLGFKSYGHRIAERRRRGSPQWDPGSTV